MSRLLRTSPPAPAAPPGASSSTPTRRYPRPPAGDWPPFYPLVKEHRVLVVRSSPAGVRSRAGSTTKPHTIPILSFTKHSHGCNKIPLAPSQPPGRPELRRIFFEVRDSKNRPARNRADAIPPSPLNAALTPPCPAPAGLGQSRRHVVSASGQRHMGATPSERVVPLVHRPRSAIRRAPDALPPVRCQLKR